jgi:hypothetical protein
VGETAYRGGVAGRQVAGAAGLARQKRELDRRAAVRRALMSRRGGAAAGPAYVPAQSAYRAPAPAAPVAPRQTVAQTRERNWWEEDPGQRKTGVPKHGRSLVAGMFDGIISLFIFAIAPALLMSRAASGWGLDLSRQMAASVLIGVAIAGFAFLRWAFMRGTRQRLMLSLGQVIGVVAWILFAITPDIGLVYQEVEVHIGLIRYLALAAGSYALMSLYFVGEYLVYRPMYQDIRRARLAM